MKRYEVPARGTSTAYGRNACHTLLQIENIGLTLLVEEEQQRGSSFFVLLVLGGNR